MDAFIFMAKKEELKEYDRSLFYYNIQLILKSISRISYRDISDENLKIYKELHNHVECLVTFSNDFICYEYKEGTLTKYEKEKGKKKKLTTTKIEKEFKDFIKEFKKDALCIVIDNKYEDLNI